MVCDDAAILRWDENPEEKPKVRVGSGSGHVARCGVKAVVRFPGHYAVCSSSSAWTTSSWLGSVSLFIDS